MAHHLLINVMVGVIVALVTVLAILFWTNWGLEEELETALADLRSCEVRVSTQELSVLSLKDGIAQQNARVALLQSQTQQQQERLEVERQRSKALMLATQNEIERLRRTKPESCVAAAAEVVEWVESIRE